MVQVIMPKLGQTMEEGAIVEWVKQEGDQVKRGDVLFTVESDKAVSKLRPRHAVFCARSWCLRDRWCRYSPRWPDHPQS